MCEIGAEFSLLDNVSSTAGLHTSSHTWWWVAVGAAAAASDWAVSERPQGGRRLQVTRPQADEHRVGPLPTAVPAPRQAASGHPDQHHPDQHHPDQHRLDQPHPGHDGPGAQPVLQIFDLVKDFRGHRAVDGLSLEVQPGEVVALLGPNGAGKSTTMKACAGLALPTSGAVTVAGHPLSDRPLEARHALGYVPDVGGLFPRLTGWEHLELAARLRGLGEGWVERAHALLAALGLDDVAGRRAGGYSHGMGRKLALAIATLAGPQLLLLDEPFDGVDPGGAVVVRQLIAEAADRGAGVLVSTHLLDAAEKISDRVVVVRRGRILATGTAAELRARSATDGPLEEAYLALMAEAGAPLSSSG